MTDQSDQILLSNWYRHADAKSFKEITIRHAQMVYSTAFRLLKNPTEAEDVAQESFLELATTKRPPTRNAAAWLHRTTYRKALNAMRTDSRRRKREISYTGDQQTQVSEWEDIKEHVDQAVTDLPEKFRGPIIMHFFENQSQTDIANSMDLSRQVIHYRIGKGIEQVRQNLKQNGIKTWASGILVPVIQQNAVSTVPKTLAAGLGQIALGSAPSPLAGASIFAGGFFLGHCRR